VGETLGETNVPTRLAGDEFEAICAACDDDNLLRGWYAADGASGEFVLQQPRLR
jgi:hypothetical protein